MAPSGTQGGGLNKFQVFVLCVIGFNEAIQGNMIWSFVPFMLRRWGFPPDDIATYVGILASVFFLAQLFFVAAWGRAADKWGRRPTLLLGVAGTAISMTMFAFAPSFAVAVVSRFLTGALNGNIAVTKVYMGEICSRDNIARGFGFLSFTWGFGAIVAPSIGGFLSDPAAAYPDTFGNVEFFKAHPYALPSLFSVLCSLVALVFGLVYLPETEVFRKGLHRPKHHATPTQQAPRSGASTTIASAAAHGANDGGQAGSQCDNLAGVSNALTHGTDASAAGEGGGVHPSKGPTGMASEEGGTAHPGCGDKGHARPSTLLPSSSGVPKHQPAPVVASVEMTVNRTGMGAGMAASRTLGGHQHGGEGPTSPGNIIPKPRILASTYAPLAQEAVTNNGAAAALGRRVYDLSDSDEEGSGGGVGTLQVGAGQDAHAMSNGIRMARGGAKHATAVTLVGEAEGERDALIMVAPTLSSPPPASPSGLVVAATARGDDVAPDSSTPPPPTTYLSLLKDSAITVSIAGYGLLCMSQIVFDELLPVFCQMDAASGGLGFGSSQVGTVQMIAGGVQTLAQLFIVPTVNNRFGPVLAYRHSAWPLALLLVFPAVGRAAGTTWAVWLLLSVAVTFKTLAMAVGFTSIMITVNNASRGLHLGLVNGLSQTVAALVRTVGPAVGGSIFSASLAWTQLGPWRLHVVYAVQAITALAGFALSYWLPAWAALPPSFVGRDEEPAEVEAAKQPATTSAPRRCSSTDTTINPVSHASRCSVVDVAEEEVEDDEGEGARLRPPDRSDQVCRMQAVAVH